MHHIVLPIPSGVPLLSVHNAGGGSAVSLDTQHGGEATAAEAPTRWLLTGLLEDSGGVRRLAVVAVHRCGDPEATYLLTGSALYLAGVVLTRAYQVPRKQPGAIMPRAVRPGERCDLGSWQLGLPTSQVAA